MYPMYPIKIGFQEMESYSIGYNLLRQGPNKRLENRYFIGPKFLPNLSHKFSLNLTYLFFVRQLRRTEKHGGKTYLK